MRSPLVARAFTFLAAVLLALGLTGASCGQSALAVMPGVLNDPGNLSLRKAILAFGTGSICAELLRRSTPIKTHEDHPAMGRFFPAQCFSQDMPNGHLFIQFSGTGYAWTNATKRLTFEASAAVEYEVDFLMSGSTMYLYFRHRATSTVSFKVKVAEQPVSATVLGIPLPSGQNLAETLGPQLLRGELSRGFTVIRDNDGSASFGLGVVELGERPKMTAPYARASNGRLLLDNERIEVHQNQRDFAGPFEVTEKGHALHLTVAVDGAPGVDVIVMAQGTGKIWRDQYIGEVALAPPPSPPYLDEPVAQGLIWRRSVTLPPGNYYVVLDNSAAAGRTAPPNQPFDDRAALVSLAVEEGDAR